MYKRQVCTLLIPSQTISIPLFSYFKFFDIFGLLQAVNGQPGITNSVWPLVLLGITGLSFRGGIFIILMRQYYKNIPTELVEAAYVDGAGHLRTFGRIILPMARSMLVVVFILAFAWQWTDTFYTNTLMGGTKLLPNVVLSLANSCLLYTSRFREADWQVMAPATASCRNGTALVSPVYPECRMGTRFKFDA